MRFDVGNDPKLDNNLNILQQLKLWGGISAKGLVPKEAPLFASEMKQEYEAQGGQLGARGGLTGIE